MKKFLCYDTNDAANGKVNVDSRGILNPNSTVPSSSGEPYKSLVTDRDGGVKWEDRLAYEDKIPVNPPVNIVWDGNTEGLVASSQNHFYKVSDDVFTVDEFNQMIVTDKDGSDYFVGDHENVVRNGIICFTDVGPTIATVANAGPNPVGAPDTYPEPGVYFPADGSYTALKWFYSTVIKKLDEKFVTVPSSVLDNIEHANNLLDRKMERYNPTGTGSLSLNRASGYKTGNYSTTLGKDCAASGDYTFASGHNTKAIGQSSHAEGYASNADGAYSHVEGYMTLVKNEAQAAHAEGKGTSAYCTAQHVEGLYNESDYQGKYLHIAGNGRSVSELSNAHTLDWEGNAWYAGTVEGTAMIVKSSTSGSSKRFKITVDDSGTISATEV